MFRTGTNCYMKGHKHGFCSEVWIIYPMLLSAAGDEPPVWKNQKTWKDAGKQHVKSISFQQMHCFSNGKLIRKQEHFH